MNGIAVTSGRSIGSVSMASLLRSITDTHASNMRATGLRF